MAFPVSPATVAGFVSAQSTLDATATLKRRLAAIRKIHLLLTGKNLPQSCADFCFGACEANASAGKPFTPTPSIGFSKTPRCERGCLPTLSEVSPATPCASALRKT